METPDSDGTSREGLIESHLGLVRTIARRYAGRGAELDDLVQVGAVGLIKASNRFDPERGVAFATFAAPVIEGEIRHHVRDRTSSLRIPRKLERVGAQVRRHQTELASTLGRQPTPDEIAAALGIDAGDVERALKAETAREYVSISQGDDPVGGAPAAEGLTYTDDRLLLTGSVRSLDERERRIVFLRFHVDMTERQIAHELGISQAHVSRLLRRALSKLRKELADAVNADNGPDATLLVGGQTPPSISEVGTAVDQMLAQYLELPYHLEVRSEHDGEQLSWKGSVAELPGCMSRGRTPDEALARLRPAMESWVASAIDEHREVPLPNGKMPESSNVTSRAGRSHSGRVLVRMPVTLHEQLVSEAERAHVSLNRFATDALAAAVARSDPEQPSTLQEHPVRAGNSAPRPRANIPRALRVALATNLVVVVIAGVVAVLLLVLALQRGL